MFTMQLRRRTVRVTQHDRKIGVLDQQDRELPWRLTESEAEDIMQQAASRADAEFWSHAEPGRED
jgi:hypothetical protein